MGSILIILLVLLVTIGCIFLFLKRKQGVSGVLPTPSAPLTELPTTTQTSTQKNLDHEEIPISPPSVEETQKAPPLPAEIPEETQKIPPPAEVCEETQKTSPSPTVVPEETQATSPLPTEVYEETQKTSPSPTVVPEKPQKTSPPPTEIHEETHKNLEHEEIPISSPPVEETHKISPPVADHKETLRASLPVNEPKKTPNSPPTQSVNPNKGGIKGKSALMARFGASGPPTMIMGAPRPIGKARVEQQAPVKLPERDEEVCIADNTNRIQRRVRENRRPPARVV